MNTVHVITEIKITHKLHLHLATDENWLNHIRQKKILERNS